MTAPAGTGAPLSVGTYVVDLPCPRCGSLESILVRLSSVLTEGTDDDATLKLRARSKSTDHLCGSRRLLDGAGQITGQLTIAELGTDEAGVTS